MFITRPKALKSGIHRLLLSPREATTHLTLPHTSIQTLWAKWVWTFIWWDCTTIWSITKYNTEEVLIFLKHKLEGNVQKHCMVNSLTAHNWFHLLHCVGKLIKTAQRTQTHNTIQDLYNDNLNSCLIQCIFTILAFMNAQVSHIKLIPCQCLFWFYI